MLLDLLHQQPEDKTKRGMAVDYVKMWKLC